MVPRPNGRGNTRFQLNSRNPLLASMVPRPNGRGNSDSNPAVGSMEFKLQWCPDQTAGETCFIDAPKASHSFALQWCPDQTAGETLVMFVPVLASFFSFNGAPTKRPGKPLAS